MNNLATLLAESAWADRDRVAVRQDDLALTYAQLNDSSARVAKLLHAKGVRPDDRVALVMPNATEFPVTYYGVLRAGGVVVPMNPLLKARKIAFVLRDSGSRIVLACPPFADEAAAAAAEVGADCLVTNPTDFGSLVQATDPMPQVVDRAEDVTGVILYTSGTTGIPKGAELTHRNLMTNAATAAETLLHVGPNDVLFGGLPLFHAFGQTCALNTAIAAGATLTLLPRFEPAKALEIMHRDRVTVFLGVPTMYTALLHAGIPDGYDLSRLNLAVSGGVSLPVERHEGLLEPSGRDRGSPPGRVVSQRRSRPWRRGRLLLHRRPEEGPHHPWRIQRLSARDRGGALRTPRCRRSRCRRRAARDPRGGGGRRGDAPGRCTDHRRPDT